jgi:hypothetical protein
MRNAATRLCLQNLKKKFSCGQKFKILRGYIIQRGGMEILILALVKARYSRSGALTALKDEWLGTTLAEVVSKRKIGVYNPISDSMVNWMSKTGFKSDDCIKIGEKINLFVYPTTSAESKYLKILSNFKTLKSR